MTKERDELLRLLAEKLEEAIRESWRRAVTEHGDEQIYTYVLFTEPLLGYVGPSFNSEAGHRREVMAGRNDEDERWFPVSWPYQLEHRELFDEAQLVLDQLYEGVDEEEDDDERGWQGRWNAFMGALKKLDGEGLFGAGQQREQLTLNIMWGDADAEAHVRSARELNPLQSYLRYAQSQLPSLDSRQAEIERGESVYREESLASVKATIAMIKNDLETVKQR